MKLIVQTLAHQQGEVQVNPETDTFDDLRQKIRDCFGFPEGCGITLIHQTKVLNKTDAKINSIEKIKDGDKIVIMKKKAVPTPSASPAAAATTSQGITQAPSPVAPAPVPAPTGAHPAAAPSAVPVPAVPVAPPATAEVSAIPTVPSPALPTQAPSAGQPGRPPEDLSNVLLTGSAAEEAISNMTAMGFPRDQVVLALRAAFNNPDRAVEYLLSGNIPTEEAAPGPTVTPAPPGGQAIQGPEPTQTIQAPRTTATTQAPRPATQSPSQTDEPFPGAPSRGAVPGQAVEAQEGDMDEEAGLYGDEMEDEDEDEEGAAVMGQEMAQQLRQMLMEDPSALPALLQQIGQTNPELMQLIQAEPELFFRMLGAGGAMGAGGGSSAGALPQRTAIEIHLTREEIETVQRIESLGFPRDTVVQAFLACDKNEDATANFLFDNADWARDQGDAAEPHVEEPPPGTGPPGGGASGGGDSSAMGGQDGNAQPPPQ